MPSRSQVVLVEVLQGAAAVFRYVQPVRVEAQRGAGRVDKLVDDVQPRVDEGDVPALVFEQDPPAPRVVPEPALYSIVQEDAVEPARGAVGIVPRDYFVVASFYIPIGVSIVVVVNYIYYIIIYFHDVFSYRMYADSLRV